MEKMTPEPAIERGGATRCDSQRDDVREPCVRAIEIEIGSMRISRAYPVNDLIWDLPEEKRERKAIADCQRDLAMSADLLSQEPIVIRG